MYDHAIFQQPLKAWLFPRQNCITRYCPTISVVIFIANIILHKNFGTSDNHLFIKLDILLFKWNYLFIFVLFCVCALYVICCYMSSVVICHMLLYVICCYMSSVVICHILLYVIFCCMSYFVICHLLLYVIFCYMSSFVICHLLLYVWY